MIKSILKKIPLVKSIIYYLKNLLKKPDFDSFNQQLQRIILNQYKTYSVEDKRIYENLSESGFRCFSQFEEDGIILFILSSIGFKTRKVVEMCIGNGEECMAANLVINHGFQGFLFDGDADNIIHAKKFFNSKKDCILNFPYIKNSWITKENVNSLLRNSCGEVEVDLLSLDVDGNDYYIWEAISVINPRLCVFETHNVIPSDLSLTIPYKHDFNYEDGSSDESDFRGVSLLAMKKLSALKGYRLIGSHQNGFNVFFLRNDIGQDFFPEVSVEKIHENRYTEKAQNERWPVVKKMPWVSV